ncbi:MAG: hypothetical protein RL760_251 [Candidatus Eisenbacteria bacterium]|jgi:hypothetical protein
MKPFIPVTALSDPRRTMPTDPTLRLRAADAAVESLTAEQRRLDRMGLEWPLARTQQQLRYWRFVRALCAVAAEAA